METNKLTPEEIERVDKILEQRIVGMVAGRITITDPGGPMLTLTLNEARDYISKRHPIIHDGKTLEELAAYSKRLTCQVVGEQNEGLLDVEIWEKLGAKEQRRIIEDNAYIRTLNK